MRHHQLNNINAGPSSAPHSISVEITKNADSSFVPDLNLSLDKSTLSIVSNSNDTDKFLGLDDELNMFQNAEDNFNGETSNKADENFDPRRLHVYVHSENLISSGKCQEMEPDHNDLSKEVSSTNNNCNRIGNLSDEERCLYYVSPPVDDYDATTSHRSEKCETSFIEVESSESQAVCHVQRNTLNSKDGLQSDLDSGPSSAGDKTSDVEDDIRGKNAVSQHSQVCRIDMLEEIIDEAKTNKVL